MMASHMESPMPSKLLIQLRKLELAKYRLGEDKPSLPAKKEASND